MNFQRLFPSSIRASLFLLVVLTFPASVLAQAQLDFDGDGTSDFTYVINGSGSAMLWKSLSSFTSQEQLSEEFGLTSDKVAIARWSGEDDPNLAVIRQDDKGRLYWKSLQGGFIAEHKLGQAGDLALSGADFDGNGTADAAAIRIVTKGGRQKVLWTVRLNMFASAGSRLKRLTFGQPGDRAFYISADGEKDLIAAFGRLGKRIRLTTRDLVSGQVRTYRRFPAALARAPRPRPFPLRQDSGADLVAFLLQDQAETRIRVYRLDGTLVARDTLAATGSFITGDYAPEAPGEEIVLQTATKLVIYNPNNRQKTERDTITGQLLTTVNAHLFAALTPTPTPTAAASPTPTATPTGTPAS